MGFDYSEEVTYQDIQAEGRHVVRVHLGGLLKRCTGCGKTYDLIKGFGRLRRMKRDEHDYRTQPRCKTCRGGYDD